MPIPLAALISALSADPSVVQAPAFKPGDTWDFNDTHELSTSGFHAAPVEMRIQRVEAEDVLVGVKTPGAPVDYEDHLVGLDWSPLRLVDGKPVRTGRPLSFPLSVGKTWVADYDNPNRYGRQVFAHFHATYTVAGWEDVTTPAGAFRAVRIEEREQIDAKLDPVAGAVGGVLAGPQGATTFTQTERSGPTEAHHVMLSTFYYVPAVKAVVKSVEEQFNANGIRTSRDTRELIRFSPAA